MRPPTRPPPLTLNEARSRLLQVQLGRVDARQAVLDTAHFSRSGAAASLKKAHSAIKPRLEIATANVSKDGLAQAAYDKRTGEWKVKATGGRRTEFGLAGALHDHHIGREGVQLGRRKQQSNFFLTINTNKRRFDEMADTRAVEYAIQQCFSDQLVSILTFGPAHPDTYANDVKHADQVIEHVEVKAGVERGPVTGALHAHLYLTITHWSQLRINIPALQDLFKESYNSRAVTKIGPRARPAVQIKLQPQTDFGQIVAHYLSKQIAPSAVQ